MIFIGYQKIGSDVECRSSDTQIGTFPKLSECFAACRSTPGCKYFVYGKGQSAKGKCYWEHSTNGKCPEGLKNDAPYDFYGLGTLFYK